MNGNLLGLFLILLINNSFAQRSRYYADEERKFRWYAYFNEPDIDGVLRDSDFGRLNPDSIDVLIITPYAKIREIDISWEKLKSLRTIDINSSSLTGFPEGISKASKIEEVNICLFELTKFPEELYKLEELKWLTLYPANIDSISDEIQNFRQLKLIRIEQRMPIFDQAHGVFVSNKIFNIETLETLKVNGWTDSIPSGHTGGNNLKSLSVGIRYLNSEITDFKQLEYLDLVLYDIHKIPFELTDFPSLKYLNFIGNLPTDLKLNSSSVNSICVFNTAINLFPSDLSQMTNLENITFIFTVVRSLSPSILFPPGLKEIIFDRDGKNDEIISQLKSGYPEISIQESTICF